MIIGITYENGTIFQHFGHTLQFEIVNVVNQEIVSDEVVGVGEVGHEALAGFLKKLGVEVLICGSIGQNACEALKMNQIEVYAGNVGDAKESLKFFLAGNLEQHSEANCTSEHHHKKVLEKKIK